MIYLGLRNWEFTDEKTNEHKKGTSIHLAKPIAEDSGTGFESLKKSISKDFDYNMLTGLTPLDNVNCFFDDYARLTFIQKVDKPTAKANG